MRALPACLLLLACSPLERLTPATPDESNTGPLAPPGAARIPQCPALFPGTDEGTTAPGVPEFGCYGACGPSCKAVCQEREVSLNLEGVGADGKPTCKVCRYKLNSCKSHPSCRWHDDCYRQCDIAWLKHKPNEAIPGVPNNLCYLNCDNALVSSCGADWTDLPVVGSPGEISPECWDGSVVKFSLATTEEVQAGACGAATTVAACPWPSSDAQWPVSGAAPPASLPENGTCWSSANCPNPNTECERVYGPLPGRCRVVAGSRLPSAAYLPSSVASCF